jgi:hypothetical protein
MIFSNIYYAEGKIEILNQLMENNQQIIQQLAPLIGGEKTNPLQFFNTLIIEESHTIIPLITEEIQCAKVNRSQVMKLYKMAKRISFKILELKINKQTKLIDKALRATTMFNGEILWNKSFINNDGVVNQKSSFTKKLSFSTNKALNAGNTILSVYCQLQEDKINLWDKKKDIFIKLVSLLNKIMELKLILFKLYLKICYLQSTLEKDISNMAFINQEIIIGKSNKMCKYLDKYFNHWSELLKSENSLFLITGKKIGNIFYFQESGNQIVYGKGKREQKFSHRQLISMVKKECNSTNQSRNYQKYIFNMLNSNLSKNLQLQSINQVLSYIFALVHYDVQKTWKNDLGTEIDTSALTKTWSISAGNLIEAFGGIINSNLTHKKRAEEIHQRCKNIFTELSQEISNLEINEQKLIAITKQRTLYERKKQEEKEKYMGGLISKEKQQKYIIKFLCREIDILIRNNEIAKNQFIILFFAKNMMNKL